MHARPVVGGIFMLYFFRDPDRCGPEDQALAVSGADGLVRNVSADRRYNNEASRTADINDLIIDSISACARPVRAMIDAHNRMYGDGSGEAFLLGPYLDVLPAALVRQVKAKVKTR